MMKKNLDQCKLNMKLYTMYTTNRVSKNTDTHVYTTCIRYNYNRCVKTHTLKHKYVLITISLSKLDNILHA